MPSIQKCNGAHWVLVAIELKYKEFYQLNQFHAEGQLTICMELGILLLHHLIYGCSTSLLCDMEPK